MTDDFVKNTAQPGKKTDIFMKNGNESRDVIGDSWKRYRCLWAEIGKYGTRKEPVRLQDSLLFPLKEKKINEDMLIGLSPKGPN